MGYLVPGVCETIQVMAGAARMPVRVFAAGLLLAAVPWAVVDATIGSAMLAAVTSGWGAAVLVPVLLAVMVGIVHRRQRSGTAAPTGVPAVVA